MEFPDLGKNCSNSECKQLDFLPVVCDACNKVFCLSHYQYDSHSCPNSFQRDNQVPICPLCNQPVPLRKGELPDVRVNSHIENDCLDGRAVRKRSTIYKNRCSFEKCKQKELIPITCDMCRKNFCLKHRNPLDHKCITKREIRPINDSTGNGNRTNNAWSLSKSGEAALRRIQAATSTVTNVINPNPSDNQSSSRIKSVQGNLSEDEALARALQQSLNEKTSQSALRGATRSQTIIRNNRSKDKNCSVT